MLELWSQYADFVCSLTGCAQCRQRRENRRRARVAQCKTIDQLKDLGVTKFRRRYLGLGSSAEEAIGFLGDLRFVVGPHGSIKLEGYVDTDKAANVAKLYR